VASEGASERRARQAARAYERLFRGRLAVLVRILLPAAMLAAIYLPLRAALQEVAWQSSARSDVRLALAPYQDRMVKQSVEFGRRQIRLSLVAIGDRASNQEALAAVTTEIMRRTGTAPLIEATFVADADALERVAARMPTVVTPTPAPAPPPPPGPAFSTALDDLVAARWPAPGGTLLATRIRFASTPTVELIHLGDELGAAARALLAPEISTALGLTVHVTERALPAAPRTVTRDVAAPELATWLGGAGELLDTARDLDVVACLEAPAPPVVPRGRRPLPPDPARELTVATLTARAGAGRHELAYTDRWSVHFARGACTPAAAPAP
jgi:hypothetical protein